MHDHSDAPSVSAPAFCEIHEGMFNGTGEGGMVDHQGNLYVVREGNEHGPFWKIDPQTGRPVLRENGAVWYEPHKWQAGGTPEDAATGKGQFRKFDIWTAFEIAPEFAVVKVATPASRMQQARTALLRREANLLTVSDYMTRFNDTREEAITEMKFLGSPERYLLGADGKPSNLTGLEWILAPNNTSPGPNTPCPEAGCSENPQ